MLTYIHLIKAKGHKATNMPSYASCMSVVSTILSAVFYWTIRASVYFMVTVSSCSRACGFHVFQVLCVLYFVIIY